VEVVDGPDFLQGDPAAAAAQALVGQAAESHQEVGQVVPGPAEEQEGETEGFARPKVAAARRFEDERPGGLRLRRRAVQRRGHLRREDRAEGARFGPLAGGAVGRGVEAGDPAQFVPERAAQDGAGVLGQLDRFFRPQNQFIFGKTEGKV